MDMCRKHFNWNNSCIWSNLPCRTVCLNKADSHSEMMRVQKAKWYQHIPKTSLQNDAWSSEHVQAQRKMSARNDFTALKTTSYRMLEIVFGTLWHGFFQYYQANCHWGWYLESFLWSSVKTRVDAVAYKWWISNNLLDSEGILFFDYKSKGSIITGIRWYFTSFDGRN